jgi:hypothetical protein
MGFSNFDSKPVPAFMWDLIFGTDTISSQRKEYELRVGIPCTSNIAYTSFCTLFLTYRSFFPSVTSKSLILKFLIFLF